MTGTERRALAARNLCLVVGEASCRGPWLAAVRRALSCEHAGCIGLVQLREKDIDDDEFLARAALLREVLDASGESHALILNDRVHLVAAAGADGVHLGEDDMDPTEARALLGPDLLIGMSTHDRTEIDAAAAAGADYAGLGPCYATATKQLTRPPRGRDLVPVAEGAPIPVYLIGGIGPDNASSLAARAMTWPVRVAVGAGILSAPDPAAAAEEILVAIDV